MHFMDNNDSGTLLEDPLFFSSGPTDSRSNEVSAVKGLTL